MSDERHSEVLGGLPRTRPHRRSEKRRPPAASEAVQAASEAVQAASEAVQAASEAPPPTETKRKPKPGPATAPKRAARGRLRQPAQPAGSPSAGPAEAVGAASTKAASERPGRARPGPAPARRDPPPAAKPAPPRGGDILGTAVQAAAELAEIGLSVGARAIRRAVSRLPRP